MLPNGRVSTGSRTGFKPADWRTNQKAWDLALLCLRAFLAMCSLCCLLHVQSTRPILTQHLAENDDETSASFANFDKDSTAFKLLSQQQRMIYLSQDQRNEFWAECYSVSGVCTPLLGTVTMNEKTKKGLPYACTHVLKAGQTEQVCLPRVRE